MIKINKLFFILTIFGLLSACSNKTNNQAEQQLINLINKDSVSYELWLQTFLLIYEAKIIQLKIINEEENKLEEKTKIFRDSLLLSVEQEMNKNSDNKEISLLREAVKYNDFNKYSKVAHNGFLSGNVFEIEGYRYALYMAEKHDFAPAYHTIYLYFIKLNLIIQRNKGIKKTSEHPLNLLNKNQQNLALYCLIKSYKKGDIHNASTLSEYCRNGIYFPKSIETADALDSIYETLNKKENYVMKIDPPQRY